MFDCRSGKDTGPWKWWNLIKCYVWAYLRSTEKSILYEYLWLVGSLASILQSAFSVHLCFIEAMGEYKGVEVADVKTDLNRICCLRPSAPAVTGRKDQQMHNMLGVSTVTTVFTHVYVGIEPSLPSLCQCMLACWWYLMIFVYICLDYLQWLFCKLLRTSGLVFSRFLPTSFDL